MTPKQLKAIRKKLNITQSELAKATGYQTNTVSAWEQGVNKISPRASKAINDQTKKSKYYPF